MKSMFLIMSLILVGVLGEVSYNVSFRLNFTDTNYSIDAYTIVNFTEGISIDTFFSVINTTFNGTIKNSSEAQQPINGTIMIDSPMFLNWDNIRISGNYTENDKQVGFEGVLSLSTNIKRPTVPLEGTIDFRNGTIVDIEGEIYDISQVE